MRECRETPVQPLQTLAVSGSSSVTPTLVRVAAESPGHSLSEAIDERGDPASKEWHLIVPAANGFLASSQRASFKFCLPFWTQDRNSAIQVLLVAH